MFWVPTTTHGEIVNLATSYKVKVHSHDSATGKHEVRAWYSDEDCYDVLFTSLNREACIEFVSNLFRKMMPPGPVLDRAPSQE